MKLTSGFYIRNDVVTIAREVLGKVVYVNTPEGISAGRIVESEAYSYTERACHAYDNRRTSRTETLFGRGGIAYVYLCYGIHRLFNIVTNHENVAEAVLIRAVEPVENLSLMRTRRKIRKDTDLTSGPGKLSQALGITLDYNSCDLSGNDLWLEDDFFEPGEIIETTRIGVGYAGEDAQLPWRFYLKNSAYVSVR